MFGVRGKVCNFVHNDEIWKDHVNRELLSQRRWPDKWGFLANEYQQLQEETLRIGQTVADMEETINQENCLNERRKEESEAQEFSVPQKDRLPFPETTSKMIGWKIQPELLQSKSIERHARGKQDIVKTFKWPREGF